MGSEMCIRDRLTAEKTIFILGILAAATLLVGNLGAIAQNNLKRLLAYSSVANAGFLVLALAAWTKGDSTSASTYQIVGFYLATYLLMTVAALFALQSISQNTGTENISMLQGLAQTHPALAWTLAIIFSALAGLPLTVGFFGKFYVFQAAVSSDFNLWLAIGAGFIGVVAGFYYYFKIIRIMFWDKSLGGPDIYLSSMTKAVIYPAAILIVVLGIYPQPIFTLLGN